MDAQNKLDEPYGHQKTVGGNRNVNPLFDPEVRRKDYLQFKFFLHTHHLLNMQEFSKKFLTLMKVSVNSFQLSHFSPVLIDNSCVKCCMQEGLFMPKKNQDRS